MFGRVNWKHAFLEDSARLRELVCDGAQQKLVIPLLIRHPYVAAAADHVALVRLFNVGLIPRIYVSFQHSPSTLESDVISRLKVTFPGNDVTFSVRSSKPDRTLICVSSSSGTEKQPPS